MMGGDESRLINTDADGTQWAERWLPAPRILEVVMSNNYTVSVNRPLVGVLAALLLVGAAVCWVMRPEDQFLRAAFVRVGLLMAALWIALPTSTRQAAWAEVSPAKFVGLLLAVFAVARFPRTILPLLIVVAGLGWFLRRKGPKRTTGN